MLQIGIYYCLLLAGLAGMLFSGFGWLTFITYYIGMPLGAVIIWRQGGGRYSALGFFRYPQTIWHITLGIVGAAGAVLGIFALMRAAGWVEVTSVSSDLSRLFASLIVQQAVVAVLEELTFRGVIQQLLIDRFGFLRGLAGASAAFGFFHLPNILAHDVPAELIPLTILNLTLMGLVFGWAFHRTNQHLALPIALHFSWNVASFGLMEAQTPVFSGSRWITGVADWFPESGLLAALGLAVVGLLVWRLKITRNDTSSAAR